MFLYYGIFLKRVHKKTRGRAVGIDISPVAIGELNKIPGLKGYVQSAEEMNIEGKFDLCIISHVLEHCTNSKKVINNILDHLKVGGYLFIEVPLEKERNTPNLEAGHNILYRTEEDLLSQLPKCLKIKKTELSTKRLNISQRKIEKKLKNRLSGPGPRRWFRVLCERIEK